MIRLWRRTKTLVTDYTLLLKRADIDVISIALPNYLHASVDLAALQPKKHVMLDEADRHQPSKTGKEVRIR